MRTYTFWAVVGVLCVTLFLVVPSEMPEVCHIEHEGNGVYWFDCDDRAFAKAYSHFKNEHSILEVIRTYRSFIVVVKQ